MKKIIKNTANSIRIHRTDIVCHILTVCSSCGFRSLIALKEVCNIMSRYILVEEVFTRSFAAAVSFLILFLSDSAALDCSQKVFDCFKVSVILLPINIKHTSLA